MAVIIKGIDILEPSAGTNSLQWAWQNGGPASGEVLIFGENGLLTNGTPVIPESTGTTTSTPGSSIDVTEFYPTDMNAADNLSNYPGFTNAMYFNGSDYLSRTPTTAGNRRKHTISLWAKQTKPAYNGSLFSAEVSTSFLDSLSFAGGTGYGLLHQRFNSPTVNYVPLTEPLLRDFSAWYHIVFVYDLAQPAQADKTKFYVNGVLQPIASYDGGTGANTIYDSAINSTSIHRIGYYYSSNPSIFNGYLANIQFIDGQALDASYFGQYLMDADGNPISAWAPKLFDGTSSTGEADVTNDYGTNGFLLDFSKLGLDSSGDIDKVYDTAPISGSHSAANDWTAH